MPRFRYAEVMLAFLRENYPSMALVDLTKAFNAAFFLDKTPAQLKAALKNYRIVSGRHSSEITRGKSRLFTPEQVAFIRTRYQFLSHVELATALNVEFGIAVTAGQVRSFVRNHHITCGRTGCYEKGNRPWNAGTKGQGLTGANVHSFKPGNVPANVRPLGFERIGKHGYIEIKVAERCPYTGFPTRFRSKHVVVWEQHHGPVPPGMLIRFLDGDKTNCDIANLAMVSQGENAILNKSGISGLPAEIMPSCIALARLRKKMGDKRRGK